MSESSSFRDYYADLGLTPNATAAQIKTAYHRLALLHHPDKQGPNSDGDTSQFRKAHEAYESLYARKLREEAAQHPSDSNGPSGERSDATSTEETPKKGSYEEFIRPFNIFNPRPRTPPPDVPGKKVPASERFPNAKFYDVGTEFEEDEPQFANSSRKRGY